jgi:large subunit ribosomal protein L17
MRHRVKGRQLNRDANHRKALRRNLIRSFIKSGEIETSLAKAKSVKPEIDKLVTHAKSGSVHHQRLIQAELQDPSLVSLMVHTLVPQMQRQSGYTKIIRTGRRQGDNMLTAKLTWSDQITYTQSDAVKPKEIAKETRKDLQKTTIASAPKATKKTTKKTEK